MSFAYQAMGIEAFRYVIPLTLTVVPAFFLPRLPFAFRWRHIGMSAAAVVLFVLPYVMLTSRALHTGIHPADLHRGGVHLAGIHWVGIHMPGGLFAMYQLLAVALPEELFFRGYIQESLMQGAYGRGAAGDTGVCGKGKAAIVLSSVLFALCHGIVGLVTGEATPLLTFFPSLVMGWLYFKTSNLVPPILFHWVANIAYASI
ncbi:MAG: CPBP family intramembrane metalloprotease [Nitrospirae bacterium]|nr:CPBP family intramembrane metalloprotease [Nitrospirota bacterium]